MNRLLLFSAFATSAFALTSCQNELDMGGVPGWLADGAKIRDEPEPYRPDPAIIEYDSQSGPIEFGMITDKRQYKAAAKKKAAKPAADPLERGRDHRINRLVR